MKEITANEILNNYDNILFDAFGVLVNAEGAIDHAGAFLEELKQRKKTYYVVSNGSKFLATKSAESYRKRGLNITDENVITSGSLKDWFNDNPNHKSIKASWT